MKWLYLIACVIQLVGLAILRDDVFDTLMIASLFLLAFLQQVALDGASD